MNGKFVLDALKALSEETVKLSIQQCDFALHARKTRVKRGRIFDFTCKNGA